MQDEQVEIKNEKEISEKEESINDRRFKDRFQMLGKGLRKRLPQFTIVSLIGWGINTLAVFLSEVILYALWPHLSEIFIIIKDENLFSYSIIGFIALLVGIAAATMSNFLLNKFWTFSGAKHENIFLQFLKYAVVGGSGAILKLFLTSGFNLLFIKVIPQEKYSLPRSSEK